MQNCKKLNQFGDVRLQIVSILRLPKMKKIQHVGLYSHFLPVSYSVADAMQFIGGRGAKMQWGPGKFLVTTPFKLSETWEMPFLMYSSFI